MAARGARAGARSRRPSASSAAATPSSASQWVAAFVQRLRELGWIENRNIAIEYRWAEGRSERFAEIAAEFVRLKVDVIMTWSGGPVDCSKAGDSGHPHRVRLGGRIRSAAAWSPVWRVRAATSPACRSSRLILSASGSNCCARLSRVSVDWRSWPMPTVPAPCSRCPR